MQPPSRRSESAATLWYPATLSPNARRFRLPAAAWSLAAIFAAALILRLLHVAAVGAPQEMPGLARKYHVAAEHLLAGDGFWLSVGTAPIPFCDRLPGYVVLRAALLTLAGASTGAMVALHAAIGALQAPVLAATAARLSRLPPARGGLPPAAWLAGLLVAAWPPLWKADVQLLETGACGTALALVVLGLAQATGAAQRSAVASTGLVAVASTGLVAVASTALVAVASTACFTLRPDAQLVPVLAAGLLFLATRRLKGALAVLLLPLVVAVPWAARNARVADGPFVSVGLGANLLGALGESVRADRPLLDDRAVALSEGSTSLFWPDPLRRDRARLREGLALVRQEPVAYAKGCLRRLAVSVSLYQGRLWPWGSLPEDHVERWRREHPGAPRYDGLVRATLDWALGSPLLFALTFGWGPALLALSATGIVRLRRRLRDVAPALALAAMGLLVHVPLHAEPRYFMPYVGLLLLVGALGTADAA